MPLGQILVNIVAIGRSTKAMKTISSIPPVNNMMNMSGIPNSRFFLVVKRMFRGMSRIEIAQLTRISVLHSYYLKK